MSTEGTPSRDPHAPEAAPPSSAVAESPAVDSAAPPLEGEVAPTYSPEQIQQAQLAQGVGGGASWFFWIAALTVVNAFLISANSPIGFAVGFTLCDIVTAIAKESNAAFWGVGFAILSGALYAGLGMIAGRGAAWAFLLGIAILAVDTLLTIPLLPDSIISLGIHLWAIYSMFTGFNAARQLKRLVQAT